MNSKTLPIAGILLGALMYACTTTIPETDSTPPLIRFEMRVPGIDPIVLTSEDEFEETIINLRANARYLFHYAASDTGGLRLMRMQYPDFVQLTGITDSFTNRVISPLSQMLEWTGDRDNPVNGMIASGNIVIPPSSVFSGSNGTLRLFASDYGGRSGTPNSSSMTISIQFIETHPVGIVARY